MRLELIDLQSDAPADLLRSVSLLEVYSSLKQERFCAKLIFFFQFANKQFNWAELC